MERLNTIDLALEINSISNHLSSISREMNMLIHQFDSLELTNEDFKKLIILLHEDVFCHFQSTISTIRSFDAMVELIKLSGGSYEKNW